MYEVVAHPSSRYAPRTKLNADSADLTIALAADLTTAGEKLTHRVAGVNYLGIKLTRGMDWLPVARKLWVELRRRDGSRLNVAGNGIYTLSKHGWDQAAINEFVTRVIGKVHEHWPITHLVSGGQTGVDMAGAVAACYLGIPARITLPAGFLQRFEDGKDVRGTRESVVMQIETGAREVAQRLRSEPGDGPARPSLP